MWVKIAQERKGLGKFSGLLAAAVLRETLLRQPRARFSDDLHVAPQRREHAQRAAADRVVRPQQRHAIAAGLGAHVKLGRGAGPPRARLDFHDAPLLAAQSALRDEAAEIRGAHAALSPNLGAPARPAS